MEPQLPQLCSQFEQTLLASLVSTSPLSHLQENEEVGDPDGSGNDFAPGLFAQIFAVALERAGGVGMAGQLARTLARR